MTLDQELDRLQKLLNELRTRTDGHLRDRFSRSLPFADGMFDRWQRAQELGFGEGASIYDSASLFGDVRVGAQTWIGPGTLLDGSGGVLSIGTHCSISAGVHIYTHDTVLWALSGGIVERATGAVEIGDRVHVGAQSVVARGVTIGDGSVVAANSFVRSDVEAGSVVAGTPATVIGLVVGVGKDVRLEIDAR